MVVSKNRQFYNKTYLHKNIYVDDALGQFVLWQEYENVNEDAPPP